MFGPDALIPDWGRPGYNPEPDISTPGGGIMMGAGDGAKIMPAYQHFDINEISSLFSGDWDIPGTAPSLNSPGFGMVEHSYSEVMSRHYGNNRPLSDFADPRMINHAKPAGKTYASDYAPTQEDKEKAAAKRRQALGGSVIVTGEGVHHSSGVESEDGKERDYNLRGQAGVDHQKKEARRHHRRANFWKGVGISAVAVGLIAIGAWVVGGCLGAVAIGIAIRGLATRLAGRFLASRAGQWLIGAGIAFANTIARWGNSSANWANRGTVRYGPGWVPQAGAKINRFAFGGKRHWIHGHIHRYNWYKPWEWIHKLFNKKWYDKPKK